MAINPHQCACCGATESVEEHHLYLKSQGCPDDLTVFLCSTCHGRVHRVKRAVDMSGAVKAGIERARKKGAVIGGRITDSRRNAAVAKALREGGSPTQIAKDCRCGRATVYRIRAQILADPSMVFTEEPVDPAYRRRVEIASALASGMSRDEVKEKFACNRQTLLRASELLNASGTGVQKTAV